MKLSWMSLTITFLAAALAPVHGTEAATFGDRARLTTIADANRGTRNSIDIGEPGPSQGDLFVFDQPLMSERHMDIGSNSGSCVVTRLGEYSECQWTLSFSQGAVVVAGQEAERGVSTVAVSGATGAFAGWTGEMTSSPLGNGTFSQRLRLICGLPACADLPPIE